MFCGNCGKKLEDGAMFCGECGAKVEAQAAPVPEANPVAEASPVVEAAPVAEEVPATEEPKKEKKKGGKKVVLIIIILLILAAGGVAAWYFTGDDFNSKRNMKKAEAAFAAGELEDAKEFYEAALERDATLTEAYLKLAEMDLQSNPERALDTLKKGMDNTKKEEGAGDLLSAKLVEAYCAVVDAHLEKKKAEKAMTVLNEGTIQLGEAPFKAKKIEVYNALIDVTHGHKNKIAIINEAFEATKDESFVEKRRQVSHWMESSAESEIGDLMIARTYEEALDVAREVYATTKNESFLEEQLPRVYKAWAAYERINGDNEEAIRILEQGLAEIDSYSMREDLQQITSRRIVTQKVAKSTDGSTEVTMYNEEGLEAEYFYYEDNTLISHRITDKYILGMAQHIVEMDGEGNIISETDMVTDTSDQGRIYTYTCKDGNGKKLHVWEMGVRDNQRFYESYDENEEVVYRQDATYDEFYNITSETLTENGKETVTYYENIYDEEEKLRDVKCTAPNGDITYTLYGDGTKSVKTFNSNEELIYEEESASKDGFLLYYFVSCEKYAYSETYTYDEAGNLKMAEYQDLKTGDITCKAYDYEESDLKKSVTCRTMENGVDLGSVTEITTYSEDGHELSYEVLDGDGNTTYKRLREYDKHGNMTYEREISIESDRELFMDYTYGFKE